MSAAVANQNKLSTSHSTSNSRQTAAEYKIRCALPPTHIRAAVSILVWAIPRFPKNVTGVNIRSTAKGTHYSVGRKKQMSVVQSRLDVHSCRMLLSVFSA